MAIREGINVNVKNKNDNISLHSNHLIEVIKLLIKQGANVNEKNNQGETPRYVKPAHDSLRIAVSVIDAVRRKTKAIRFTQGNGCKRRMYAHQDTSLRAIFWYFLVIGFRISTITSIARLTSDRLKLEVD